MRDQRRRRRASASSARRAPRPAVSHPNVCQLFDIGDIDGTPFLVMELLDGESLARKLARGPLPLAEAISITLSILTALEALHGRGFVHRDLKPSNVFLTAHGVKLLDFGLARELHAGATVRRRHDDATRQRSPLTLSGMIVGTPRYMAPEQLLGAPVDARTDLFSAGALLYEMISRRAAVRRTTNRDAALPRDRLREPAEPRRLRGDLRDQPRHPSRHGQAAEDRYQSAGAMAQDLRETMLISDAASPVVAHNVTRLHRPPLPHPSRRSRDRLPRARHARGDHDVAGRRSDR